MVKNKDPTLWFVCKFCRRAFSRRKYLIRHKRQFHPKNKRQQTKETDQLPPKVCVDDVVAKVVEEEDKSKKLVDHLVVKESAEDKSEKLGQDDKEEVVVQEIQVKSEKMNDDHVAHETGEGKSAQNLEDDDDDDDVVILDEPKKLLEPPPGGGGAGQQEMIKRLKRGRGKLEEAFSTMGDLVGHLTTLGGYECTTCLKYCTSMYDLERHQRVHTGKLPFGCKLCEKSYLTKTQLKTHLLKGHSSSTNDVEGSTTTTNMSVIDDADNVDDRSAQEDDDDDQKIGQVSPKTNNTKSGVSNQHSLKKMGQNLPPPDPKKRFKCHYCPKYFESHSGRTIHERVHTGEMPFQCKKCDARFTCRSNLNSHTRRWHK